MLRGHARGACFRDIRRAYTVGAVPRVALGAAPRAILGACFTRTLRGMLRGLFNCCTMVVLKVHALVGNFGGAKMYFGTCAIRGRFGYRREYGV